MNLTIYVHRYVLRSAAPLNAASVRQEFQGALIRVVGGSGDSGYGCVHPWPELGDAAVDEQLAMLKSGQSSPILASALTCAQADGDARREGRSLFDGVDVPRSHATLLMDEVAFERAVYAGFDRVKVKMGRDLKGESEFVRRMAEVYPALRWRMDFNGTCSQEEIASFVEVCDERFLERIDFFEDGCCSSSRKIAQAVDREVETQLEQCDVAVVKPAVNEVSPLLQRAQIAGKRVVVTSYMDHPLGQSFAAWQAALARRDYLGLVDACGLITHGLFESDVFTESLGPPSPNFHPAAGTGLGFDSLLEALPWTRLC